MLHINIILTHTRTRDRSSRQELLTPFDVKANPLDELLVCDQRASNYGRRNTSHLTILMAHNLSELHSFGVAYASS